MARYSQFFPQARLLKNIQIISEKPHAAEAGDSHAAQPVPGNGPLQPESSGREDLSIQQ